MARIQHVYSRQVSTLAVYSRSTIHDKIPSRQPIRTPELYTYARIRSTCSALLANVSTAPLSTTLERISPPSAQLQHLDLLSIQLPISKAHQEARQRFQPGPWRVLPFMHQPMALVPSRRSYVTSFINQPQVTTGDAGSTGACLFLQMRQPHSHAQATFARRVLKLRSRERRPSPRPGIRPQLGHGATDSPLSPAER